MLELFLSDIHFPWHDPDAWKLTLAVAKETQPDIIFLGGDIFDFYSVSSYSKDPARKLSLQNDIDIAVKELQRLRETVPNARYYFLEGNHEDRMRRYLWNRAEELSGLRSISLPELLHLQDATYISRLTQHVPFKIGELFHIHGDEVSGGSINPARNILLKITGNVIFGHYHRIGVYYHRMLNGKSYGGYANGCLCTLTPEYMLFPQWNQGFSLIDYTDNGLFQVNQVPIFRDNTDLCCIAWGELFKVSTVKTQRTQK